MCNDEHENQITAIGVRSRHIRRANQEDTDSKRIQTFFKFNGLEARLVWRDNNVC